MKLELQLMLLWAVLPSFYLASCEVLILLLNAEAVRQSQPSTTNWLHTFTALAGLSEIAAV